MKIWPKFGKKSEVDTTKKAHSIETVAIFGYSDCSEKDILFQEAANVASCLAKAGYTVVDGGGPGVMRAATMGAHHGGGKTIGVTFYPKSDDPHINYEGRDLKNDFDKEIKAGNYVERTLALMREGQVYVIFNGGTGTISEFGMAWGLARLYFGHHKPLILYGKFWENILRCFKENMLIRPQELKVYKIVNSSQEVLDAICEFEAEINRGEHKHHLKATKDDFSI